MEQSLAEWMMEESESEKRFNEFLRNHSGDMTPAYEHFDKAEAHSMKSEYDQAIAEYIAGLLIFPCHSLALVNLAQLYDIQGQQEEAERFFILAAEIDDEFHGSHVGLGDLYLRQEKYDEAIDEYVTALEIEPNAGEVVFNLGYALYKTGDFDAARDVLKTMFTWKYITEEERSEVEAILKKIDESQT